MSSVSVSLKCLVLLRTVTRTLLPRACRTCDSLPASTQARAARCDHPALSDKGRRSSSHPLLSLPPGELMWALAAMLSGSSGHMGARGSVTAPAEAPSDVQDHLPTLWWGVNIPRTSTPADAKRGRDELSLGGPVTLQAHGQNRPEDVNPRGEVSHAATDDDLRGQVILPQRVPTL